MTGKTEQAFLRIVDWDDFQYADTRKKPNPPWRWCRLPRLLMDSPDFQRMTMTQRGAFCSLLMLASETGNLIPDDQKFLRNRVQLDTRVKLSLTKLGMIEQISLPSDSQQVKDLRRIYSGGLPEYGRRVEGEGEKKRGRGEGEENLPPASKTRDPLPRTGATSAGALVNGAQGDGKDTRSFDELKAIVMATATTLNRWDPAEIWRLAHGKLAMSETQFRHCIKQLVEDGERFTGRF